MSPVRSNAMIQSEADVRAGTVHQQPTRPEPARATAPPTQSLGDKLVPDLEEQIASSEVRAQMDFALPEEREAVATRLAIDATLADVARQHPELTEADLAELRRELEGGAR